MATERRIALCVARFYEELADKLEQGARETLAEAGYGDADCFDVPGAFELPLAAKYVAESGRYAAVVCLGAVIRGETDHYEYVCAEAARHLERRARDLGPMRLRGAHRRHDGTGPRARQGRRQARHRPPRRRGRALGTGGQGRAGGTARTGGLRRPLSGPSVAASAAAVRPPWPWPLPPGARLGT